MRKLLTLGLLGLAACAPSQEQVEREVISEIYRKLPEIATALYVVGKENEQLRADVISYVDENNDRKLQRGECATLLECLGYSTDILPEGVAEPIILSFGEEDEGAKTVIVPKIGDEGARTYLVVPKKGLQKYAKSVRAIRGLQPPQPDGPF